MGETVLESLIIFSVVCEPLRFVARWCMRRGSVIAKNQAIPASGEPPIADLCWIVVSPVTRVLQYLSMVMAGRSRRLALPFSRRFRLFNEWASARPEWHARLRRAMEISAAWVTNGMLNYHLSSLWCFASPQDDRRTVEERNLIWQDIKASSRKFCQLVEWFGQVFFRMHSDKDSIASLPEMKVALNVWAWQVWCTIASGEHKHGRNRRRSHHDNNWLSFASHGYTQDLKTKWCLAASVARTKQRVAHASEG